MDKVTGKDIHRGTAGLVLSDFGDTSTGGGIGKTYNGEVGTRIDYGTKSYSDFFEGVGVAQTRLRHVLRGNCVSSNRTCLEEY